MHTAPGSQPFPAFGHVERLGLGKRVCARAVLFYGRANMFNTSFSQQSNLYLVHLSSVQGKPRAAHKVPCTVRTRYGTAWSRHHRGPFSRQIVPSAAQECASGGLRPSHPTWVRRFPFFFDAWSVHSTLNLADDIATTMTIFAVGPQASDVGLPLDWKGAGLFSGTQFVWPPGAHHAKASGVTLPKTQAASSGAISDDVVEPFGGVEAAVVARVLALAAPPAPPMNAADYVLAHQLQPSLDAALNTLVQSELPAAPWEALIRCLPADLMVPPPSTLPSQGMDAASLGLDRLKDEFLWLHSIDM